MTQQTSSNPYGLLPATIRSEVQEYIEHGIPMCEFMENVAECDLAGAACWADDANAAQLVSIVRWFVAYAPMECWGSAARVKAWVGRRGIDELEVANAG